MNDFFLDFDKPIALIVPTTVDITVAITATKIVIYNDSIMMHQITFFVYHCIENPVKMR